MNTLRIAWFSVGVITLLVIHPLFKHYTESKLLIIFFFSFISIGFITGIISKKEKKYTIYYLLSSLLPIYCLMGLGMYINRETNGWNYIGAYIIFTCSMSFVLGLYVSYLNNLLIKIVSLFIIIIIGFVSCKICWPIVNYYIRSTDRVALQKEHRNDIHLSQQSVESLHYLNGDKFDIHLIKNKIIIINFWSKSCSFCNVKLDKINKITSTWKKNDVLFLVVGINGKRELSNIKLVQRKYGTRFIYLYDEDGNFYNQFTANGIPFEVIFNRKGQKRHQLLGYTHDFDLIYPSITSFIIGKLKNESQYIHFHYNNSH